MSTYILFALQMDLRLLRNCIQQKIEHIFFIFCETCTATVIYKACIHIYLQPFEPQLFLAINPFTIV